MKRAFLIASVVLTLAGCNASTVDANIEKVQTAAAKVCGFVPTVSTVASIIAAVTGVGPAVDIVKLAADKICTAVTKPGVSTLEGSNKPAPTVDGVKVEGYWIK